jgi:hypothetical protein
MASGEGEPQFPPDDKSIADDINLWRRVHPKHFVPDGHGGKRISSAAFTNSSDGSFMSVVIGEEDVTAERVLGANFNQGLVTFTAGFARSMDQRVIRKPVDTEPLHGEVCGKKSKPIQNSFVTGSLWIFSPI